MCGRYAYFNDLELKEIIKIADGVSKDPDVHKMKTGEIRPTDIAPVLVQSDGIIIPRLYSWGFPGFNGKGVIINARLETVSQKLMFRSALDEGRCVIPSTGFYEWDSKKQKHLLRLPDSPMLYMAGISRLFEGRNRFVILTGPSNASMSEIHERLPLILSKHQIRDWLSDREAVTAILAQESPILINQIQVG